MLDNYGRRDNGKPLLRKYDRILLSGLFIVLIFMLFVMFFDRSPDLEKTEEIFSLYLEKEITKGVKEEFSKNIKISINKHLTDKKIDKVLLKVISDELEEKRASIIKKRKPAIYKNMGDNDLKNYTLISENSVLGENYISYTGKEHELNKEFCLKKTTINAENKAIDYAAKIGADAINIIKNEPNLVCHNTDGKYRKVEYKVRLNYQLLRLKKGFKLKTTGRENVNKEE